MDGLPRDTGLGETQGHWGGLEEERVSFGMVVEMTLWTTALGQKAVMGWLGHWLPLGVGSPDVLWKVVVFLEQPSPQGGRKGSFSMRESSRGRKEGGP